ncbi:mas-related G-protein coupled receptor member X2-like [Equus asinus]|uniref:G-protein coupled receptors family 1 profile domain-containing protein n=1 Tax=Equus asinus TaxID=9793 RepID=A0A9L0K9Q4_EQUAS|nr:mas-related G-protein coupled receptor member X2-like [Equus asinus]XP_046542108.1 mas-related G-protein coupled receptor member X2-like [Equus quagga]
MEESVTSGGFLSMNPNVTAWGTKLTTTDNHESLPKCDTKTVIQALLTFTIALVGLAGNAIVLWILGFHMRRNPFTVYILNLAGADFIFLCSQIVLNLEGLIALFHSLSFSIASIFITVWNFAYFAGLSILTAISTERCLSVLCPIWYRCRRPKHTSTVICALLWALSLVLSVLNRYYCGFLYSTFEDGWCPISHFSNATWLTFLFVVFSASSIALLVKIFCSSRRVKVTRLGVTILLTMLVFLLCGLPFSIHWFLAIRIQNGFNTFLCYLYMVTIVLSGINSSANPIIYFFVGSFRQWRLKQNLKLVLQRALQDTPEAEEGDGSIPQETLDMSTSKLEQ